MKQYKSLLFSFLALWPLSGWSQVTFEARIDTLVMLIGEQRELTLDVT